MHIAGLILARGGSKGIPLKNLALVNGRPILQWTLDAMSRCKGFSSIWVSSDHDEILDVALKNGAKVHRRSPETATDDATSLCAITEFINCHPEADIVGLVQCTSPFVLSEDLEIACQKMMTGGFDSVFSVRRCHSLRWVENDAGNIEAGNFNPLHRPKRQDWKGDLLENGAFYFSTVALLRQGLIQGGKISWVEMSAVSSLDIDTSYDLWLAEQQAIHFDLGYR